jgi:hypothetical protein
MEARRWGALLLSGGVAVVVTLLALAAAGPGPGADQGAEAGADAAQGDPPAGVPGALSAEPPGPLALGALTLGDEFADALATLGPPDRQQPDLGGTSHVWTVGRAELLVTVWDHGPEELAGLYIDVAEGSGVEARAWGGIVIGRSTVDDVLAAWGPGVPASDPWSDYAVRYTRCLGVAPVVVKFGSGADGPDDVVTTARIAVADAAPGTEGCTPA